MNNKSKNISIKKNAIMSGLNRGLSLLFPLITFAYVSRVLGVTNYGKYNFSQSIYSYFSLAAGLGIATYAVREGVKYRNDEEKISRFASEIFSINLITTFISYIALFALLWISDGLAEYKDCILICSISMFFSTIGIEWFYGIYEEYTYITVRSAVFKVISLLLMLIFVRQQEHYLRYAAVCVFATSGSCVLNFLRSKKYCEIRLIWKNNFKYHIKPLIIFAAMNIAVYIYNSSDITMLGIFSTDSEVGLYAAASKMYRLIKSVLLAVLTVTIPRLSLYIGQEDKSKYGDLLEKVIHFMNLTMIPMIVLVIMEGRDILFIVAGADYLGAYSSLVILTLAVICSMYAWISSQCVLVPNGKEKENLIGTVYGAIMNICLNIFLIPMFGSAGAAFTTILAEFFVAVYCTVKAKTVADFRYVDKDMISILLGSVGMILCGFLISGFVTNLYCRFVLSSIISSGLYIIILLLMKNRYAVEIFESVKKVMNYK
ncbi:MAG: flippase [Bacteroidales bacterium]|nr:flippase [Lachnoclostridium sp.]MCM1384125.1 flippase [Lachnoclostridium sp.]MCM1465685.1 flippase [Bacteroidales bacterium]